MMHAAKELQVALPIDPSQRTHSLAGAFHRARAEAAICVSQISQRVGSNPAQIKVRAEWPADAVPVTGLAQVALLAFCFEVEFERCALITFPPALRR
jgi:hypothetical protein